MSTFERPPENSNRCPSELTMDRLHLGEMRSVERIAVEVHIGECAQCQKRAALRDAGFAAFRTLDSAALAERVNARWATDAEDRATPVRPRRSRRWIGGKDVALLTTLLVTLGISTLELATRAPAERTEPIEPAARIRAKGSIGLRVFRKRGPQIEETSSGEAFLPGDHVRFQLTGGGGSEKSPVELAIVGITENGERSVYFPLDGARSSRATQNVSEEVLPGTTELDADAKSEWVFVVRCPRPFAIDELEAPRWGELEAPQGCQKGAFLMRLESR